ncbi:MAG: 3-oxoacyl-ACP synthase [Bacteroidota bacterium]|nr:3-oxoacyl-ACP synthase [Bacteroidota bacterium]
MQNSNYIQSYLSITKGELKLNNSPTIHANNKDFKDFSKKIYTTFNISYPKFFKMDNLSKLAFLGAYILLEKHKLSNTNTALVFANKSSSLDTDIKHQQSISDTDNYFPSPAIFVYTLPNICLGEIAIKFKLHTENSFFIFEEFNTDYMIKYTNHLLKANLANHVLWAWVEILEQEYTAHFCLVNQQTTHLEHNTETIKNIF